MMWTDLKRGDILMFFDPFVVEGRMHADGAIYVVTRDPWVAPSRRFGRWGQQIAWVEILDLETGRLDESERPGMLWPRLVVVRDGNVLDRSAEAG